MSNSELLARAPRFLVGGVDSPVRSFRSVGGEPRIIEWGEGPYLIDVEGRRYIDYVGAWGASILGHAPASVVEAVSRAAQKGLNFGATCANEIALAEKIVAMMPSIEKIRLVNSGTEATMTAIRLARGFTGRDLIVKFDGCYHGHVDSLLVKAGSGALTLGQPDSAGIPDAVAALTAVLPYNDIAALDRLFDERGSEIAAVIVEPIAGNMNLVMPDPAFLDRLRNRCRASESLLIFDEVMTGFRVGPQGAQGLFGILPDLTCLGKVIGGGMPVGAVGGRADVMDYLAPLGPVYQAGTASGNPMTAAAGLATLEAISVPGFYDRLTALSQRLVEGFKVAAGRAGVTFSAQSVGAMFGLYFSEKSPHNRTETEAFDLLAFRRFFAAMLEAGVYLAPSAFEAGFLSAAHDEAVIDQTIAAARVAFDSITRG